MVRDKQYWKDYYSNPEVKKIKIQRAIEWNKNHLERKRENARLSAQRKRDSDREGYNQKMRELTRIKTRDRKILLLEHYGKSCACCGETIFEFLTIDHINNNGAEHRRKIGRSETYKWLIENNFPEGFQILCMNCNSAKGFYGKCPHENLK